MVCLRSCPCDKIDDAQHHVPFGASDFGLCRNRPCPEGNPGTDGPYASFEAYQPGCLHRREVSGALGRHSGPSRSAHIGLLRDSPVDGIRSDAFAALGGLPDFWELAIVVAVALLFSTFSSPILSALFTIGVYIAGRLSDELMEQVRFVRRMGEVEGTESIVMEKAAEIVHAVFPGLYRYDIAAYVVHGIALPSHYVLWNSLYAIGYIGIFLAVSSWWFSRRDFV